MHIRSHTVIVPFVLALLGLASASSAQSINPPARLAPIAGSYYTPEFGQAGIGFYGTDLGWSFQHQGKIRFLFGDSWADTNGTAIGPLGDDSQGTIDLATFPTGASVDSWVAAHPWLDFPWHAAGPPLHMRTNAFGKVAPMPVYDGGSGGALLNMGLGRTPVAGFSNGTTGAFAIFNRGVGTTCTVSPATCTVGTCDNTIPKCQNSAEPEACYVYQYPGGIVPFGSPTDSCLPFTGPCVVQAPNAGFCRDSTYAGTSTEAKFLNVVQDMRVGNSDQSLNIEEQYYTTIWRTNKFTNVVARSVQQYTPGGAHDYHPVVAAPGSTARVFLWGRPLFVGAASAGRSLPLYFAYVDLPQYTAVGPSAWAPHYFAGMSGSTPTFTTSEAAAVPVTLTGGEPYDIVDQMTVSYVPNMNKWVMLYGGDIHPNILQGFELANYPHSVRAADLAIHVRFASDPWGPWTAAAQAYAPGQPTGAGTGEFASPGMIHWAGCMGTPCVKHEGNVVYALTDFGFLYAPSIVDAWTTAQGLDADIYWTVSTWDPYEVVLMKSRLKH